MEMLILLILLNKCIEFIHNYSPSKYQNEQIIVFAGHFIAYWIISNIYYQFFVNSFLLIQMIYLGGDGAVSNAL